MPSALKDAEGKVISYCGDVCLVIPDKLLGLKAVKLIRAAFSCPKYCAGVVLS